METFNLTRIKTHVGFTYTITTVRSVTRNTARGLSTDHVCEVDTGGHIPSTDRKKYYCIYCADMLKNCQRETKLF